MSISHTFFTALLLLASCFAGAQGTPAQPSVAAGAPPASITVVTDDNYPPYIFRNAEGELQGILKDTWALWQARTGIKVKLQAMDGASAQGLMADGRADVIDAIAKTEALQAVFDFSAPYAQFEVALFFHQSISGITDADATHGFTVGVKDGAACIDLLQRHRVGSLKKYASFSAMVEAAKAGDLRVFCMDETPGHYLLNQYGVANEFRHSPSIANGALYRAVRKGNGALLATLDDGFARITAAEYKQIKDKWMGTAIHAFGNGPYGYYLRVGLLLALVLVGLLALWTRMLRREVQARTAKLSQAMQALGQARQVSDDALARLQKLANRVPGMVCQFLLRPDGSACIPYASEAIQDIFRLSPQQVKDDASGIYAAVHPDDLAALNATIAQSASSLTHWQHEFRVKFGDADVRWLFGNSVPEQLTDGSVLWHGFVTDITKRRIDDEKLRQLSLAVEQAPLAVVIANLDGNIEYVNPRFTEGTGYSLEEVSGKNPRVLQSGLTSFDVYQDMWQTLLAGAVWSGQFHNRKKNGDLYIEQAVIAPVLGANGKTTHYVAMKEDITQRIRVDVELQASLKEKVALLNEVHHRVKNNLQVITSLLRLEAGRSELPDTKAVLLEMQGRIQSMALLHEALYRDGNFASIDLGAYLRQLATQAFRAQGATSGAVRLVLDLAPASVALDQATPCGLLVNELLSNALKHGFADGRGGEVQVRSQPSGKPGLWQVCVRDTGAGLPVDYEARRAHSLGLQLVSDLTQQLGGTLETWAGPGPGTTFCVTFALEEPRLPCAL